MHKNVKYFENYDEERAGPRPYFNLSDKDIRKALKAAFLPFKSVHSQHAAVGIKVC